MSLEETAEHTVKCYRTANYTSLPNCIRADLMRAACAEFSWADIPLTLDIAGAEEQFQDALGTLMHAKVMAESQSPWQLGRHHEAGEALLALIQAHASRQLRELVQRQLNIAWAELFEEPDGNWQADYSARVAEQV